MEQDRLEFDLIVIGAGMAGLSAAARAAESGLRVAVVEAAPTHGGSAALSGGVAWTLQSARKMHYHGEGDPRLSSIVAEGYRDALAWLRRREVAMSTALDVLNGRGYQLDILGHFTQCIVTVEGAGGAIVYDTIAESLLTDKAGGVIGVRTRHADGPADLFAPWTLLATGGFQASGALRERYLGPHGRHMLLRSNPFSDGGAIRLATSVGAAAPKANTGFYGHLVSESPKWGDPGLFTRLSQYHSEYAVLLNEQGHRFCDETDGDHANTHRTLQQSGARALMIADDEIHQTYGMSPIVATAVPEDRMAVALKHGGRGVIAATFEEIGAFAEAARFDGAQVVATLRDYNDLARNGWERLSPPRTSHRHKPLATPPFYALIVHPAITFTFAGLAADEQMRVLDSAGKPVAGLAVAGADVGDIFRTGYGGGLAAAITTGLRAAMTIVTDLKR